MVAIALHRAGHRAMVIDLGIDQSAIQGAEPPTGPGFGDWLATPTADSSALARLGVDLPSFHLIGPGRLSGVTAIGRLKGIDDHTLLDAGLVTADDGHVAAVVGAAERSYLVVRPCYLALRRAAALNLRKDGVILVSEPGRSLSADDVGEVLGAPVVAIVELDPATARAVDAGRVSHRSFKIPRSIEKLAAGFHGDRLRYAG